MCNGSQGLNKRNKHRMRKTYGYSSCGEMRQNAYMRGKSHSNISANGKTNRETNQKGNKSHTNQYPCTENGAEEAESHRGAMLAAEDHGKTAHDASVNARRVMECNTLHILVHCVCAFVHMRGMEDGNAHRYCATGLLWMHCP